MNRLSRDLTFRRAISSDDAGFVSLMNHSFVTQRPNSYFNWQYDHSLYPTALMLACSNDEIVGCYGVAIRHLSTGATCAQAMDIVVHEHYRRLGILNELERKAEDFAFEHKAVVMLGIANSAGIIGLKAMGWSTVAKIPELSIATSVRAAALLRETYSNNFVRLERTAAFRAQRFEQHCNYVYAEISAASGSYVIFKLYKDEKSNELIGDIVDYKCESNYLQSLQELFFKATKTIQEHGVDRVSTWALSHTPHALALESLGYSSGSSRRYFSAKVLDKSHLHLYDLRSWLLVPADSELF